MSRHLCQRYLDPLLAAHQQPADRVRTVPKIPGIPNLDRVALAPLDRGRHLVAAERHGQHLLRIGRGEPVSRQGLRVGPDVEIPAAERPLRVNAGGTAELRERTFNIVPDPLNHLQVGSEDLDAERGTYAGREHVGAILDRHGPAVTAPVMRSR